MKISKIVFTILLVVSASFSSASEKYKSIAFDYSAVKDIYVYTEGGTKSVVFPTPLDTEFSIGPAVLYRDILAALSNQQPITMPLGESKYIIDLLGEGEFKRFYLGDAWISDGQTISLLSDNNPIITHIDKRFMVGSPISFSTDDQDRNYGKLGQLDELDSLMDEELTSIRELEQNSIASTLAFSEQLIEGKQGYLEKLYWLSPDEPHQASDDDPHQPPIEEADQSLGDEPLQPSIDKSESRQFQPKTILKIPTENISDSKLNDESPLPEKPNEEIINAYENNVNKQPDLAVDTFNWVNILFFILAIVILFFLRKIFSHVH